MTEKKNKEEEEEEEEREKNEIYLSSYPKAGRPIGGMPSAMIGG